MIEGIFAVWIVGAVVSFFWQAFRTWEDPTAREILFWPLYLAGWIVRNATLAVREAITGRDP